MTIEMATIHKRNAWGYVIMIGDVAVGLGLSKADCLPLTDELNLSEEKRNYVLGIVSGLPDLEL